MHKKGSSTIPDEELKRHWEDTGQIRETTRRLKKFSYNAVYKRLVQLNLIRTSTFDPGRYGYASRTIPEATTLIIPDLQAPAHHPDALAFLCAVRDKYKGRDQLNVVCIGDEVDLNFLSDFQRLPEVDQPTSEWAAAQAFMRSFYAEFPEGVSCVSNHVEGRISKARTRGRLPPAFLRSVEDLLDAPPGWSWHSSIRMGDVLIRHGHRDTAGLKRLIVEEIPAEHGRHFSLLIGHFHSRIGVATPDIKIGNRFYWGAFSGCLVNPRHPFFSYSKGTEKLGTVVLSHGRVIPVAMPVDEYGRWTGVLP
jgi:hypothetical protein